jgi:hypothetical protein
MPDRIARDDRDGQKALAEYILRNALSEQKIAYLEGTGKVVYRSAMTHGGNKKEFGTFTAVVPYSAMPFQPHRGSHDA